MAVTTFVTCRKSPWPPVIEMTFPAQESWGADQLILDRRHKAVVASGQCRGR